MPSVVERHTGCLCAEQFAVLEVPIRIVHIADEGGSAVA
jgi:hypothetical protein